MTEEIRAYRIGGGRRAPHWAHRWHVDFWFRSWQAEHPELCRFARRGWTPRMAVWLMARDAAAAVKGRRSFHQRRKTRKANLRDAVRTATGG